MSLFVVDASVGVKWFVPEADAAFAQRLQDPAHELHIPTSSTWKWPTSFGRRGGAAS
jgi:predicted nucleic acid-binding protein